MGSGQVAMSPSALEWCRTEWPCASSAATRGRPRKPVAPVTRILFFIRQELLAPFIKLFDGTHVVVHAANIQPIARVAFHVYGFFARKHVQHQIVEAVLLPRRHALEYRSIQ